MDLTRENNTCLSGAFKGRIAYLDSMKGFAMLCVVLGHIADGYLHSNLYPDSNKILYMLYNIIYSFHMPLFIMISGYLYHCAYFGGKAGPKTSKIYRQVGNLTIVYILFSVLLGCFKIVCSSFVNTGVTWKDILMIGVKTIAPYWYLYILVAFYLIFLIKPIAECDYRIILAFTFVLCIVSGFVNSDIWFEIKRIMYYSFFWGLGFVYHKKRDLFLFRRNVSFLFLGISVGVIVIFWNEEHYICQLPIANMVSALGICLGLWWLFEHLKYWNTVDNSLLQLMGKYCLEIYVIHCFLTAGNRAVFSKLGIQNLYLSILLNLMISIGLPILFARLCKKIGVHDLIFRPVNYFLGRML